MKKQAFSRRFFSLSFFLLLFCSGSFAQQVIEGKVMDENKQPLNGATVAVKGTKNKTITDLFGNFKIKANESDKLVISFVGYQEFETDATSASSVLLTPGDKSMSEVVVTALGVRK